jgi:hypothetical protein
VPAIVEPVRRTDSVTAERVRPQQLYRACDAAALGFQTTDESQARAFKVAGEGSDVQRPRAGSTAI